MKECVVITYLLLLALILVQHINIVQVDLLLPQSSFGCNRICRLVLFIVITLLILRNFPSFEGSHLELIFRHLDCEEALLSCDSDRFK